MTDIAISDVIAHPLRVVLPQPQPIDVKGGNIKLCDLVHLQARVVRMADHDLGIAHAVRRAFDRTTTALTTDPGGQP